VRRLRWTLRAREDLANIRASINEQSPSYAALVVGRVITATNRLAQFPESGRAPPRLASLGVGSYRLAARRRGLPSPVSSARS